MSIFIKGPKTGKRAKEVFSSNSEVVSVFIDQDRDRGRAGNVFFKNNYIYSYGHHYLMAAIYSASTVEGGRIMLVNRDGYSSSTRQHKGHLYGSGILTIDVNNCDISGGHDCNIKYLSDKIDNLMANIVKAKRSVDCLAGNYVTAIKQYNRYITAFGLKNDKKTYDKADLEQICDKKRELAQTRALKSSLKWLGGKINKPILSYEAPYMMRFNEGVITANHNPWQKWQVEDFRKLFSTGQGEIGNGYYRLDCKALGDGSFEIGNNILEKKYVDILKDQINFVETAIGEIVL